MIPGTFAVLVRNLCRPFFYYNKCRRCNMYQYQNFMPYQAQANNIYRQNGDLQSGNCLIRVTGLEGAKAYQMGPNSTVALFDGADDLMYIKTTDGAGFPTIRMFKFEEVLSPTSMSVTNDYMTRQEVKEYVEQLISAGTAKRNDEPAQSGNGECE